MSDSVIKNSQDQALEQATEVVQLAPSPGALLAARREELGLTVERVAEQLKMTTRQIHAIETDNYVAMHGKAIYRGFVRAYAKVLKMDAAPLVAMIPDDSPTAAGLTPAWQGMSKPYAETRLPTLGRPNYQSKRMIIAIIVVASVIGILVVQKMGWLPTLPKTTVTSEESSSSASEAGNVAAPVELSGNEKLKQVDLPLVDVSSQLSSAPAPVPAVPVADATAVAAPPADSAVASPVVAAAGVGNALVLKCRDQSWVEIRRTNGVLLFSRLVKAGETETFDVTEPVQLTLGNGLEVDATLRGTPLDIKPESGNKVVRLNLK